MTTIPRKIASFSLLGVGALAACGLAFLTLTSRDRPTPVSLDPTDAVPHGSTRAAFRFAVAPVLSPERTMDQYRRLTDYVANRLHQPVALVLRKTYTEVNELLRLGNVQAAIICTGAYLRARADGVPIEAVAVPVYAEGAVYHALLIVRSDSRIQDLDGLRGRRFAYSDPLSLTGHDYPILLLLRRGLDPSTFFTGTTFTYSHDGSLRAVLDGIADAASVDSFIYDTELRANPALAAQLRVIERSPPLPIQPVVLARRVAPEVRKVVCAALLEMEATPEGRAVLAALGPTRFEAVPPGFYDELAAELAPVLRQRER